MESSKMEEHEKGSERAKKRVVPPGQREEYNLEDWAYHKIWTAIANLVVGKFEVFENLVVNDERNEQQTQTWFLSE